MFFSEAANTFPFFGILHILSIKNTLLFPKEEAVHQRYKIYRNMFSYALVGDGTTGIPAIKSGIGPFVLAWYASPQCLSLYTEGNEVVFKHSFHYQVLCNREQFLPVTFHQSAAHYLLHF